MYCMYAYLHTGLKCIIVNRTCVVDVDLVVVVLGGSVKMGIQLQQLPGRGFSPRSQNLSTQSTNEQS
jgi:hypothetical protein